MCFSPSLALSRKCRVLPEYNRGKFEFGDLYNGQSDEQTNGVCDVGCVSERGEEAGSTI